MKFRSNNCPKSFSNNIHTDKLSIQKDRGYLKFACHPTLINPSYTSLKDHHTITVHPLINAMPQIPESQNAKNPKTITNNISSNPRPTTPPKPKPKPIQSLLFPLPTTIAPMNLARTQPLESDDWPFTSRTARARA